MSICDMCLSVDKLFLYDKQIAMRSLQTWMSQTQDAQSSCVLPEAQDRRVHLNFAIKYGFGSEKGSVVVGNMEGRVLLGIQSLC